MVSAQTDVSEIPIRRVNPIIQHRFVDIHSEHVIPAGRKRTGVRTRPTPHVEDTGTGLQLEQIEQLLAVTSDEREVSVVPGGVPVH